MFIDFEPLFKELRLSEEEKGLIEEQRNNHDNANRSFSNIVSNIYNAKKIEKSINELIKSNEKYSKSNQKYVVVMTILTGVLVVIGIFQIILFWKTS